MSLDFSREATDFLAGGKKSDVVPFTPGSEARKQCQIYGLSCEQIALRLIRVRREGGEIEVLATSLLDEDEHTLSAGLNAPIVCAGAWKRGISAKNAGSK